MEQQFETIVENGDSGRVFIRIPFDPRSTWGARPHHYVNGTLNGHAFAGSLGMRDDGFIMPLNKELRQQAGIAPGDRVSVAMAPGEARVRDLPADLKRALNDAPDAWQFFDGLSAFYRNQYIEWVEAAKQPQTRLERIERAVALLKQGIKQHD